MSSQNKDFLNKHFDCEINELESLLESNNEVFNIDASTEEGVNSWLYDVTLGYKNVCLSIDVLAYLMDFRNTLINASGIQHLADNDDVRRAYINTLILMNNYSDFTALTTDNIRKKLLTESQYDDLFMEACKHDAAGYVHMMSDVNLLDYHDNKTFIKHSYDDGSVSITNSNDDSDKVMFEESDACLIRRIARFIGETKNIDSLMRIGLKHYLKLVSIIIGDTVTDINYFNKTQHVQYDTFPIRNMKLSSKKNALKVFTDVAIRLHDDVINNSGADDDSTYDNNEDSLAMKYDSDFTAFISLLKMITLHKSDFILDDKPDSEWFLSKIDYPEEFIGESLKIESSISADDYNDVLIDFIEKLRAEDAKWSKSFYGFISPLVEDIMSLFKAEIDWVSGKIIIGKSANMTFKRKAMPALMIMSSIPVELFGILIGHDMKSMNSYAMAYPSSCSPYLVSEQASSHNENILDFIMKNYDTPQHAYKIFILMRAICRNTLLDYDDSNINCLFDADAFREWLNSTTPDEVNKACEYLLNTKYFKNRQNDDSEFCDEIHDVMLSYPADVTEYLAMTDDERKELNNK